MPSIKDIVAGQSVGVGKRVIKAGADKLRGIINDRGLGKMPSFGNFKTESLTYPMDVVDDPRQGHYVVFTVREISKPAEVQKQEDAEAKAEFEKFDKRVKKGGLFKEGLKIEEGYALEEKRQAAAAPNIKIQQDYETNYADEVTRENERKYIMRPPTRRTSTLITLYMPPQVKNITGAEYESTEVSPLTTTAAASIGAMLRDDIDMGDIPVASAGKAIVKKMAELIEQVGFGGASDQLQLSTGIAIGDRMEFVFKNPKKRAFPFQFDFYPKSEKEAQEVHQIIQTFRKHMLPTTMSQNSLKGNPIFKVPNQFNIEYFYKGNENSFLNKIGNCYLTDCDITYGGDRYTAFTKSSTKDGEAGASPTEIHMTLNFQEMDIITHEDVQEGF
jgi:hypothetical protein